MVYPDRISIIYLPTLIDALTDQVLMTRILLVWCRRGDLNPHREYSPLDPESSASTNSATSAYPNESD